MTVEQKRRVVVEITQKLVNVPGNRPEHIHIIIGEVGPENRGYAGVLTAEYRKSQE